MATINIGTLTGRSRELAEILKKRRVDIACVQETKWIGAKAKHIGDGYKLFYNSRVATRNGVGIIVGEHLRGKVVEVCRVSDRLMSIKVDTGSETCLHVVSCYAPQTGCTDVEKDTFWLELDDHLRLIGPEDHILMGGELNDHVGTDRDGYPRPHGGRGFGSRSDEGVRILDLAEVHDMVVTDTFFRRRDSHLITYNSGQRTTQIDYWLVRLLDLNLVTDVKVIP